MTIKPFGDSALLVEFEQKIDLAINAQVVRLSRTIEAADLQEISFCIPAYCSLTVGYDPLKINFQELKEIIIQLAKGQEDQEQSGVSRRWRIPVCYQGSFAMDMEEVVSQTKLSPEEVIQIHTGTSFRVFMLGFIPGFVYMGKVPESLFCNRKKSPRKRVPALSVGLAGHQTGIYPSEAPGGWQIIGRTPVATFDGAREEAFLFKAGDEVRFYSISETDYHEVRAQSERGRFLPAEYYD